MRSGFGTGPLEVPQDMQVGGTLAMTNPTIAWHELLDEACMFGVHEGLPRQRRPSWWWPTKFEAKWVV